MISFSYESPQIKLILLVDCFSTLPILLCLSLSPCPPNSSHFPSPRSSCNCSFPGYNSIHSAIFYELAASLDSKGGYLRWYWFHLSVRVMNIIYQDILDIFPENSGILYLSVYLDFCIVIPSMFSKHLIIFSTSKSAWRELLLPSTFWQIHFSLPPWYAPINWHIVPLRCSWEIYQKGDGIGRVIILKKCHCGSA